MPATSSRSWTCCATACNEENVALILVTHTPEVAAQFARVEQLEEINRVFRTPVSSLS